MRAVLCCESDDGAALCCVLCFLLCVVVLSWCVTWFGTLKKPTVCKFNTPPCVHTDLVSFPMLSQFKPQAPLLVVPSPSIPSSFSLATILLPQNNNFEFS